MATVMIQRYEGKRSISYIVKYKDPITLKSRHYKTCRKYRNAQSEAAKLRELLDNGKHPTPRKKRINYMTFAEVGTVLKESWKQKLAEGDISAVSYDGYTLRLSLLEKIFRNRLLCDITEDEIKSFRLKQFEERSAATSNRNLFILKQVFKTGLELKAVMKNPVKEIKYLSEKGHERKRFLSPDEIEILVQASKEVRAKFYLPALIYLGAEHGTSKQEALNLRWNDIDFRYRGIGLIRFYRTKNSHERTEFMMPRARQALLDWQNHLEWMRKRSKIRPERTDIVFSRLNGVPIKRFDKAWNRTCALAGFVDLHYHDLRHTFCSNLILSGSDLKEVKEMIGHRDLSTTDRYAHLTAVHKKKNQDRLADHYAQQFLKIGTNLVQSSKNAKK